MGNNRSNPFKRWLATRSLSYDDFAKKSGIQYNTVVKWSQGTHPRKISQKIIKQKFPDCPLLKGQ